MLQIQISTSHIQPGVPFFIFYCSIQALLSGCSFSSVKIEIYACLVERQPTCPQTANKQPHLPVSFGRSHHQTIITTSRASAQGRCCEFFASWSIKRLCKKWHWDIIFHLFMIVSVSKGAVHLGWRPCSQPDSANTSEARDVFTELGGHHSFPVEGKTRVVQEEEHANIDVY